MKFIVLLNLILWSAVYSGCTTTDETIVRAVLNYCTVDPIARGVTRTRVNALLANHNARIVISCPVHGQSSSQVLDRELEE